MLLELLTLGGLMRLLVGAVLLAGSGAIASTITVDQTITYQFANPAWANPQEAPNADFYDGTYTADLAEVNSYIPYLTFQVTGTNGETYGAGMNPTGFNSKFLIGSYLPMTPFEPFYFTIGDGEPGIPTDVSLNDAFFGAVPVDPPLPSALTVPEPSTLPLTLLALVATASILCWRKVRFRSSAGIRRFGRSDRRRATQL